MYQRKQYLYKFKFCYLILLVLDYYWTVSFIGVIIEKTEWVLNSADHDQNA